MNTNKKTFRIYKGLTAIDWLSFNQIYTPLLSKDAAILFMSCFFQKDVNDHLDVENYDFGQFLKNYNLTEEDFKKYYGELESLGLVSASYTSSLNEEVNFSLKIKKVKSIKEALNDATLGKLLKQKLNNQKYQELKLSIEDVDFEYEIGMPIKNNEISFETKEEENIIDNQTYNEFYDGVMKLLGCEFSVSNEIIEAIKDYYIEEKKVSMKQLQDFAQMSMIKNSEGKYEISLENFLFLIEQNDKQESTTFNMSDYSNFWKEIKVTDNSKLLVQFNNLFQKHDSGNLYKFLTSKSKAPDTLNKWIKECITDKNFTFPILNGVMSFVLALLGKVPIKYLSKVTDTLYSNDTVSFEGLMQLVRSVIDSDLEKGINRLGAKVEAEKVYGLTEKEDKKGFDVYSKYK